MLYRSMGATTGQVVIIYLAYLVELCLMAVVVGDGDWGADCRSDDDNERGRVGEGF